MSGDELTLLVHVILHMTKLQLLKLRESTIEDMHQVAIELSNSKSLKIVELINNNLQLAGPQTVAKILTQSRAIRLLHVYNTMEYEGAKLLCQETLKSSAQKLALPEEYWKWMEANHPHLVPQDRVHCNHS